MKKLLFYKSYIWYMHENDLASNKLQVLICLKGQCKQSEQTEGLQWSSNDTKCLQLFRIS